MKLKYGFIGCGNMGGALIKAALKSVSEKEIAVFDKDSEKLRKLSCDTGITIAETNYIASECEYIILGVKPQMLKELFSEIMPALKERSDSFVLVSMAAGISIKMLEEMSSDKYKIIRIMPNIPVSCGEGMILYCHNENTVESEINSFLGLMDKAGRLMSLNESLIDAGSAISGCGPAYVFMFIESLADGGVKCGLPRDKAILLAAQTLLGSAKTVIESGVHPEALKDSVCSPGGTTIAGVNALEKEGFRYASQSAVIKAYDRTLELGK